MKVGFIIPYFGKWPIWFPAFLQSCASNPTIDWIFFTDCEIPDPKPDNVLFFKSTLQEVKKLACEKISMEVNLRNPRKLCDLKPTYGHVFEEYLKGYDFWGFCDIDIIWGDIRAFITDEILWEYDLITSRKETISGHFTILKNNDANRSLYRTDDEYKDLFIQEEYCWFDESTFAKIVRQKKVKKELKVYWDTYLLNVENGRDSHQEYHLDKWLYENGKLYDLGKNRNERIEYMYLHFINWKRTMESCEMVYPHNDTGFYISYNAIHLNRNGRDRIVYNNIKNLFEGYWVRERRRINKKKRQKLIERGVKKLFG